MAAEHASRRGAHAAQQNCPVARTLQLIGEWWTVLIVRDAFAGLTRFDQFRRSLDISPAILAKRLQSLVDAGIMERRRYSEHPPRDEYLLTESGRALRPVIAALRSWGEQHFGAAATILTSTPQASPEDNPESGHNKPPAPNLPAR